MNRTIQNWFTDPQFKESFQDRPYSEKKRIMETYFKEKLAAGNEEFEALPDTEKQRALYNFVYLNMAPHMPKPESRGWLADIGSAAASGFVGAGETLLRTARTVGDVLVGEEAPEEEWTSRALEKLEDYRQASPYLQPSKEATEGLRRWVYEGVQAVVQSVTAQGPATAVGLVAGGPVAAVGMYALSGGSLYGFSAYDEFMETADQRGIDRSVSQPAALKHGIAEGGFEFVTDIVEGITAGIARPLTRPGKQALKNGIKSLLETRAKEVATRIASVATIETGAEMTTAGVQAEIARDVDMGDERFWSAAQHAFGPSMVAGLIFGGMGAGITTLQRREIADRLTDPKADKKKRLEAVAEVGNELRRYSPEMANAWMINAAICVSKNQAISLEEDLTPPDAGKESADAPLAAAGQSVTDIGKTPGTVKQAGEQAREAEKQAEESQEAVNQTIKAAIDEKHAPEDAQTLLARIEESEKALSPGQVEFIRDRVEKLGSVEAAAQAYPGESVVDTFARALAEQRWGAAKTGQTAAPSPDIASDITIDEEPSLPPESPPTGPEITPQTLVEKANKARPEIELIYNGMQEGAGNEPGVHLFTFKDPETGNHPSFAVPGELSEGKLAEAIDRKIAEFKGTKEEPASPAAQEETISIEGIPEHGGKEPEKTAKGEKDKFVHDHSSTQINLPEKEAAGIRSFANKIPDSEIYEDPNDDSYGREKEPHVTVRYGMDTLDKKEIAPAFEGLGPIKAKMGKVSIFETDKYDVVKVDIESEDLQAANKRVGETVELPGETFKDYKPHTAIAYVKKGEGKKYVGDTSFEGKEITVDRVVFVAKDGKTHEFKLKEQGKKEEYTGPERRKNTEKRKRIEDMTPEEMRKALLTDELTGLGNRRAYEESEKLPTQCSIDMDSLKAVNDMFGHEAGDELLKVMGKALGSSGYRAYHMSGDEFIVQGKTEEEIDEAIEAAQAYLEENPIQIETEGEKITIPINFSYGKGETLEQADEKLREHKKERETKGERAGRGEEPKGILREPAEGGESSDRGEEVSEEVKKTLADYGLKIEKTKAKNGKTVWEVTGENTKKYKEYLKSAGARWYKFKKAWSFYQEEDPTTKILESLSVLGSKPEKPGIEKPKAPIVKGSSSSAYTHRNNKIDFEYAVIEIGDLVKSHDTALHENPSFPKEYQPRKRDRKSMVAQITVMANQIIPEKLGKSSSVSSGAPIVGNDMIVESGNGRTIALQIAYDSGKASQYKQWLKDNANEFGINPEVLAGIGSPVLVRIRKTKVDRVEFAKEANVDEIARMSPYEQARADAERLTEEDLELFRPSEDGSIISAANRPFISRFISGLGTNESAGLLAEGGDLTRQGADRIQAAIFAKAYGDERLVTMQAEEANPDAKNIINALVVASGEFAKARGLEGYQSLDIIPDIVEAAQKVRDSRNSGVSIKQILDQQGLFEVVSNRAKTIAFFMDAHIRSAKRMGLAFKTMASEIRNDLLNRKQTQMFATKPITKDEAIKKGIDYVERTERQAGNQPGLFEEDSKEGDRGSKQAGYRRTETGLAEGDRRDKRGLTEHDTYVSEEPISYQFNPVPKQRSLPFGVPYSKNTEKVRHAIRTRMATTGYIAGNGNVVLQAEDAASLLAGLRKHAQENLYSITVDKNGIVLEIHRYSKGIKFASNAMPVELAGRILNVPGAHKAYFVHNHPTRSTKPSPEDKSTHERLRQVLSTRDIDMDGIVIAGDKWVDIDSGTAHDIKPSTRKIKLEVKEKFINKVGGFPCSIKAQSPDIAKAIIEDIFKGREGFLLLGSQLEVLGFMDVPSGKPVKEAVAAIVAEAEKTNATAAVFYAHQDLDAKRKKVLSGLQGARLGLNIIDVLVKKGDIVKAAGSPGENIGDFAEIIRDGSLFYSIASVRPWSDDFPNAIPHTNQSKLVNHPDHKKAKAGDSEAAARLVEDLIKPARARELAEKYPDALLVPVYAMEAAGRNKIPAAFAQAISDITGLRIAEDIVQTNLTAHTVKNRLQRLLSRANFKGTVIPGQTYILVDDTAAQGGTLHELRHHIENNGGNVVAVTILGFGRGATVIAVKPGTIQSIERKHGREETERFLREYNISGNLEALTEGEARYVLSFSSIDALRDRCLEEGFPGIPPEIQGPFQTLGVEDSLSFPNSLSAITRENLSLAFEGAYVAPHGAEGNFKVNLPNGAHVLVEKTGRLTVSQKWLHQYRPDLEGKEPPISRGGYSPKRRTIYITDLSGQDTTDHEAFHAAQDMVLTEREMMALVRDYGDLEAQATAYEKWVADERRKPHTIFQKILDFFRRIQEIFFPTEKGVFAKVKSGEVWKRPARPPQGQELSQAARRLINTPEFKRWFKGSLVVAENGEPLVVYHGTSAPTDFDSFAPDISDLGSHFTVEPAVASYATGKTGRRRVFPVFLSIKNPLRLKDMGQWDLSFVLPQLKELGIASAKEIEEIESQIHESNYEAEEKIVRRFLGEKGYDGVVYLNRRELLARGETSLPTRRWAESLESNELSDEEFRAKFPMAQDSYIAFEPTQIKSIFNRGTFSETDTAILHQIQKPGSGGEFVKAPDGSIDFGRIDEKIGKAIKRQAGPIRLQAGEESNAAKYGLVHISARHGKKILKSGFTDIKEFVYGITTNWTEIRKGSAGSLFLAKRNGENDIAVVKLRPGDGEDFYSVVSAWRARRAWIDKKKLLWERREPARSTSGVDPRLQPLSQTRPEGEPPNASSQSLTDKIVTASEDEVKPKDDLLYQLQPPGPQVTRDLEEDRSFANRIFEQRDLGVHRAQLETQELQKQVQALAGKASRRRHVLGFAYDTRLKRSMESDRLDMAMMVWRDLQINPEKADEFKAWAKEALANPETPGRDKIRIREQFDTLERALALTDDQKALVDEIGSRFDRAFQVARANNIVNTFTDHYVRRIWNLPAGKEEDLRSTGTAYGFKTYTTAKQQRKFETMIDGWMGGYDLKVKGLTNSYGAYITDLETILANKDFIRQGYHTRDTSGNRLFSTSKKSGYEKLEASGFKVHEWAGKAEAETPPDGSQALLIDDRGRRFFYGPIERVPESWAVFKDDETKHPSRVFYDPDEASDWAAEKGYDRIEHRPEKDVANAWEERPLYAPKQLAGIINRMTRSDRLFSGTPGADALLRFNAGMKSWILLSSFFHHLAGARSWAFAVHHGWKGGRKLTDPLTGAEYRTAGVNPVKAYKAGLKKVEDRHPLITLGVKNGLTLGDIQDWSETMLRDRKGFSERLANYLGLETAVKTMEAGRFFREQFTDALFKKYFAGLKAEAFVMEYIHDLQRAHDTHVKGGPAPDPDAIAERVARLINEDFGGLHLQRMGRNPTLQKISRLLLLAPDWCVLGDTRAMTKNGWKRYDQLKIGDEIMAFDPRTHTLKWSRMKDKYVNPHYRGQMVQVSNFNRSILMTPEHTCFVRNFTTKRYEVVKAKDLQTNHLIPRCAPFPAPEEPVISDELVRLAGWLVTDGNLCNIRWTRKDGTEGRSQCGKITQSKPKNVEILKKTGLAYYIDKHNSDHGKYKARHPKHVFSIPTAKLRELHAAGIDGKSLSWEFLSKLTEKQRQILYDTMFLGDGTGQKRFCGKEKAVFWMTMLQTLMGLPTTFYQQEENCWRTRWITRGKDISVWGHHSNLRAVEHEGVIWCPSVDTGFWLAERNGLMFITGNTESNFRTVTGLIPGLNNWIDRMTGGLPAPKGMNEVYRKFWGRVALRIAASTILAQLLLNGKDDSDDFWKEQALSNRFHKFRWTQVDITKIYEILGIDPDSRMTFSIGGHFLQPLNLFDPPRLIKAKSSPLARIVESGFSGTDWAQRPFTAKKTLFGKGRTIKDSPYEETEGFFNRLPSTVANQVTGMQPIQVGYLIRYLQGEADGLSSIMGSMGVPAHKAWPPRKTEPIARAEENDPAYDLVSDLAGEELLRLGPPSGKIVVNGIPRKLTREQYEQYFEKSSEIARRKLKMVMKSAAFAKLPKEKQARIVGNVIQSARKKARALIKQRIIRSKAYTKPAVDRKAKVAA